MEAGKNLCSLHECVADKSSFSMTNYYKKGEKWENIAGWKTESGSDEHTMEKIESQSLLIFIEAEDSLAETLNQLNGSVGLQHKLNFFLLSIHLVPTLPQNADWKHFACSRRRFLFPLEHKLPNISHHRKGNFLWKNSSIFISNSKKGKMILWVVIGNAGVEIDTKWKF